MEVIVALAYEDELDGDLAVQCALLHDVIEDTPIGYETIKAEFGASVADGVLALSKNETMPKEEQIPDSLARILEQPREIAIVKLADRITNLMPPPIDWTKERRKNYHADALLIHEKLGWASDYLTQRLLMKAEEYQTYFE